MKGSGGVQILSGKQGLAISWSLGFRDVGQRFRGKTCLVKVRRFRGS